jgi:hypothetical protein
VKGGEIRPYNVSGQEKPAAAAKGISRQPRALRVYFPYRKNQFCIKKLQLIHDKA